MKDKEKSFFVRLRMGVSQLLINYLVQKIRFYFVQAFGSGKLLCYSVLKKTSHPPFPSKKSGRDLQVSHAQNVNIDS